MALQRVLQFEYQQCLVQDSNRPGWSEDVTVSVRLLSQAISTGWYRTCFASRGNDLIILLAITMHARPLHGDDLKMLINLHMATSDDEGRLYARVSDVAMADELGMSRMTIARATRRLAAQKSISIVEIPEQVIVFRDSHGRFNGSKVYLIAGEIQNQFIDKSIDRASRVTKCSMVEPVPVCQPATKYSSPVPDVDINVLDDEEDEEGTPGLNERVLAYFAKRKGEPNYHPTHKEQLALEKLIGDGFTFTQIVTGIEAAFSRPSRPNYFTHCAAITRDLVHLQQESRTPEALEDHVYPSAVLEEVIEAGLAHAIEVYRSSGREITPDLLTRFRLMATRCDQAARVVGANGGSWLADALTCAIGVAQPGNLINYADAVLNDWIANGHGNKPTKRATRPASISNKTFKAVREPTAHLGIRQYLENHEGLPSGDAD
jgi:hypothetical protein